MPTKKPVAAVLKPAKKSAPVLLDKKVADKLASKSVAAQVVAGKEVEKVPKGWVKPKTLAQAADKLYTTREERLGHDRSSKLLKEYEVAYKGFLMEELPRSEASSVGGKVARVSLVRKDIPIIENWNDFIAGRVAEYNEHVKKKTGLEATTFAFFQRSLTDTAVNEAWEQGRTIKGVGKMTVTSLSVGKA